MQSYRLLMRVAPYVKIRWALTGVAYFCTMISMALIMAQPFLFSTFIDRVLIDRDMEYLFPILGFSVGFAALSSILEMVRDSLFRYLDIRTILDLRSVVLNHLRKIPLTEIEKHGPGKFAALLAMDTATMSSFLYRVVVELTIQFVTMSFAIVMIFYLNWRMGLIALVSIPIIAVIPMFFHKPLNRYAYHVRSHNEEVGTKLYENIQGSREIRAFGLEEWESVRNGKLYKNLIESSMKETIFRAIPAQMGSFTISLIIVLLYAVSSGQIVDATLSLGVLVAIVQYLNGALRPIQAINNFIGDIKRSEVAMNRIEQFLQIPMEPSAFLDESADSQSRDVAAVTEEHIICRDLHVSYEGVDILKGVSFEVRPGQIAAFVGRSGSGKTTLFKVLMGFMQVDSGEIYLDNRSIKAWSRKSITQHIGMVFQESYIFAGTLLENISLGNLAVKESEIYDAACKVGLKTFLDALPEGLHTRVDNQGFQLSGGQRQRIAIARIIVKKPNFLILDEPTSSLDRSTEDEVLTALDELMAGKTTLISTHRLETILHADIIYVMEHGRIIDSGSYEALLNRCDTFAELVANSSRSSHVMEEK